MAMSEEERKARKRVTDKAYRDANKERIAARWAANKECYALTQKAWREANKERKAASEKAWQEANKERLIAAKKEYVAKNKERIAAREKVWRGKNKERKAASTKAWRELNKERNNFLKIRFELKSMHNITNPPEDLINLIVANRKLKRAIREISK